MRSVLYLLATFLPRHLVQEKMRRPSAGLVRGEMLEGTLLFSDVSGFTALSERLQELGVSLLTKPPVELRLVQDSMTRTV
jgi:class 3 adenylate cyclase